MFKNYFKIAWRNIRRNPVISFINIGGLALGMATAIIICLWIWNELSFNKNFPNYPQIAQVMVTGTFSGEVETDENCPPPLAEELRNNFNKDFEQVVLTTRSESHIFSYGEKKLNTSGYFVQEGFDELFSLSPVSGSTNSLADPSSVLISASFAKSLFGKENPVGKSIKLDNEDLLKISGVYQDFPHNSSFSESNYIGSWNYYKNKQPDIERWNRFHFRIYVQLPKGIDYHLIANKIAPLLKSHINDIKPVVLLHPMSKWHLYETFKNGQNTGGQIQYVWMFGWVGTFILFLACINFMNLSTAKSEKQAKEVGILKAIGSNRRFLIYRFLGESTLVVVIAFFIGNLLVWLSLPRFNQLIGSEIKMLIDQPFFWIGSFLFLLLTGLLAGCYPAFYLSSFQPINVLKGSFKIGKSVSVPRKVMVVMQFFTTTVLLIATATVLQQLNFAKDRPLGYSSRGLIHTAVKTSSPQQHFEALQHDLLRSGAVTNVSSSSSPVNHLGLSSGGYAWEGKDPNVEAILGTVSLSHDFAPTVQWQFKEGRNFSRDFPLDSSGVIINEMAARYMGIPQPVGKILYYYGEPYHIVGVIEDPIMGSPFTTAKPSAFFLGGNAKTYAGERFPMNHITIKLSPQISPQQALAKVEAIFKQYDPETPFEYDFVDQSYATQFQSVERIGTLVGIFASLAIVISCLGLYALSSFIAEQRTREIGIRKVLGASILSIWRMLSKEFLLLTGLAFLIAVPIAYWSMNQWLENYVYRISLSWELFAIIGLMATLITLITISFQSIKAALANPVDSLRNE